MPGLEIRDVVSERQYNLDRERRLRPDELRQADQYIGRIKIEQATPEKYAGDIQFYLQRIEPAKHLTKVVLLPVIMETGGTIDAPINLEIEVNGIIIPQPSRRQIVGRELGYFLADLDVWRELSKLEEQLPTKKELVSV